MALSEKQKKQVNKQLDAHRHNRYEIDLPLSQDTILNGFIVNPKVLRPEQMTSLHFARWLYSHNHFYKDKIVIDMGCGSGIQGIVTGLYGAKQIIFSDLSQAAVENTKENVKKFDLGSKAVVLRGNLFEKISEKADVIIFNHPFFADATLEELLVSSSMLDTGKLIHRFFDDSKKYLNPSGLIIMPYFKLAGPINDPLIQAPKHGYKVNEHKLKISGGIQQGDVSFYEIRLI